MSTEINSKIPIPTWFFAFVPYKIGEGLFINILPLFIVQVVNGSVADVGKINSSIALAGVIAFVFWGNLSDRVKSRRPFLIIGVIGFALSALLISSGDSVRELLNFCTLGAFLMAAVTPISTALVLDTIPEKLWSQTFGKFFLINGWSFIFALIIAAISLTFLSKWWNQSETMRLLFVVAGAGAFLSFILCLFLVEEPEKFRQSRPFTPTLIGRLPLALNERRLLFYPSRSIFYFLRPRRLQGLKDNIENPLTIYYVCSLFLFFTLQIVYLPFPLFIKDVFGASNAQVLLIVFGKSLVETILYVPMGNFIQGKNSMKVQAIALGARIAIFIALMFLAILEPSKSMGLILIGLVHLGTGITWSALGLTSTMSVAALAPKGQEAMAMGVYNSVIGVGTILGALASGYLAVTKGYSFCFGLGAVLASFTVMCLWWLAGKVNN
jgi:MFS family permease